MRLATLACITALSLAGCAIIVAPNDGNVALRTVFDREAVVGDGRVVAEHRRVAGGPELDLSGPLNMEVRVGPAASLQVEADSNLLPLVRTESGDGKLRVWIDGRVRTDHAIRVVYTVPQLTHVRATGSGRLAVTGLDGRALTLNKAGSGITQLSGKVTSLNLEHHGSGSVNATELESGNANVLLNGSGRVQLGQVRADALNVKVHGSGEATVSGSATHLNARVTGSGNANLAGLSSGRADLHITGSGDIQAQVRDALTAQTTGSGSITVRGNPSQRNVTGKGVRILN